MTVLKKGPNQFGEITPQHKIPIDAYSRPGPALLKRIKEQNYILSLIAMIYCEKRLNLNVYSEISQSLFHKYSYYLSSK